MRVLNVPSRQDYSWIVARTATQREGGGGGESKLELQIRASNENPEDLRGFMAFQLVSLARCGVVISQN